MRIPAKIKKTGIILSWALYDLANQFFALNIVSLYFVRWLILERGVPEIFYSLSFGISMFFVAVMAPVLGTFSDMTRSHKFFLALFTLLSVIFVLFMGLNDNVRLGLLFFVIANFGCQIAVVFYNSLIVNIASEDKIGFISGLGRMFGYAGAVISLYVIKPIVLQHGYRAAFIPTGLLFLFFSLPCMIFVKTKASQNKVNAFGILDKNKLKETFIDIRRSLHTTYKMPGVADFLTSVFWGLSAVNVIILFMSVYATAVFGFNETQIINLIALGTFFAILGSIFSGFLSDYIGYRNSLLWVFIFWICAFSFGSVAKSTSLCFFVGALAGLALGATWTVGRALAVSLVPKEQIGATFALFNLAGYLSGIIGALFWGGILMALSSLAQNGYRIALFSLNIFMFLGIFFLLRMKTK